MTRLCELCGRGGMIVLRRSHSNIASRTKQKINLQYHVIGSKRLRICTRCWKTERARTGK